MARISESAALFGIKIVPATPKDGKVLRVKDIFTTRDGSWEPNGNVGAGSIPQWARTTYLRPWGAPDYFDDAGADHHMLGGIFDEATQRMKTGPGNAIQWYTWTDNGNHVVMPCKERSGWANVLMYNYFNPSLGEQGAWAWYPEVAGVPADEVRGGGMPYKWHVSFFVTWVLVTNIVPPPDPDPVDPNMEARVAKLEGYARAMSATFPEGPQYD